jgi:hypothetical protein
MWVGSAHRRQGAGAPLLLSSSGRSLGVGCQQRRAWSGMAEVECGWQPERSGFLSSSPLAASSLLFGGGEVNGVDDESTTGMSGSGGVVAACAWSVV